MTACPLLNRSWRAQFSRIASTHLHIPQLSYLLYLADIIRSGKSLIYSKWELQHYPTTITCFLDLKSQRRPYRNFHVKTLEMYYIFTCMNNYIGLRRCFPSVQKLCLQMELYYRLLPTYADPRQVPLLSTTVSVIFDGDDALRIEKGSKGYGSTHKKIPFIPSSYTLQYDVEIQLDPSIREEMIQLWDNLGIFYCVVLALAIGGGLRSIRSMDLRELHTRLFQSRTIRHDGLAVLMRCDTNIKERWSRDNRDINWYLWTAGRGIIMSMFAWDSIYLRVWSYFVDFHQTLQMEWTNPRYLKWMTYKYPDVE
ncbi:hypothetical protein VKT23_014180 [Stygiomarasmius scandens]|uniref:Uncharacterized protein n=1 Tax=Marasmiellus scandens TaxID=2682957 RepID=A0ABR1J0P6_9AGAR